MPLDGSAPVRFDGGGMILGRFITSCVRTHHFVAGFIACAPIGGGVPVCAGGHGGHAGLECVGSLDELHR